MQKCNEFDEYGLYQASVGHKQWKIPIGSNTEKQYKVLTPSSRYSYCTLLCPLSIF